MHTMRQIFCNLLLFLALGLCLRSSRAQGFTATDANFSPTQPYELQTDLASHHSQTILVSTQGIILQEPTTAITTPFNPTIEQTTPEPAPNSETLATTGPMIADPTTVNTAPLNPTTEQTTPESAPETTAQIEEITMTMSTLAIYEKTTVTELKTPEAPTTNQYESTVGLNKPKMTSPSERPTALATTTISTEAANPTNHMTEEPTEGIASVMFDPVDTRTTISTETSTLQLIEDDVGSVKSFGLGFNPELIPSDFTTVTTSVHVGMIIHPEETNWLLIIIVCAIIACGVCVIVILFIQKRKKSASRAFGPVYMNGQSKRSKKKKGADDDAWAGPVNLEAGADCDAEVQEGLLPNNGKEAGEDVVFSTFATLDEEGMSNGGVGGEGTKKVKKWEEQEPMLFIDEDVDENQMGKTQAENKRLEGDGKSEENMNGGEAFCLTTAV